MNSNSRVLLITCISILVYLLISILGTLLHFNWAPFKKTNLISDIIRSDDTLQNNTDSVTEIVSLTRVAVKNKNFELYKTPKFITNFNADTSKPCMVNLMQKLYELKSGKKRKIRIAYFGDSMIEGDLLTKTLRKLLQKEFGGSGVGFVPVKSVNPGFRKTTITSSSGGWTDENFKTITNGPLFFSGHLFRGNDDWFQVADKTISDSTVQIEKSLLCGFSEGQQQIKANNTPVQINADFPFNRIVLSKDQTHQIRLSVSSKSLPVYGISFESESGVIVDNFTFRGISGVELKKLDNLFLNAMNNPVPYYDLLIFQYGINVLYKPNDKNFNWYGKLFLPVIEKMKGGFPSSEMMIISTADRAFRYEDGYKSAIGIDSLIKLQAALAFKTDCTFYNQFESMGGKNSIVSWAQTNPSLANKDYVHPNELGTDKLAGYFFEAIMNNYNRYLKNRN